MTVAKFRNIVGVNDLTNPAQLKHALYMSLTPLFKCKEFQAFPEESIFTKTIHDRTWYIARSLNHLNSRCYDIVSPIDPETVILIPATLRNAWDWQEIIPDEIEQKHLASLWDFLGHVNLSYTRESDFQPGSVIREAPGQAEKDDWTW